MNTQASVRSYTDAERFLGGRDRKKIAYETWVERLDENLIIIRHHRTAIVTYYRQVGNEPPMYRLDTGGWQTRTTRDRLNEFTPFQIDGSMESGWTGHRPMNWREWTVAWDDQEMEFEDGMVVSL